MPRILAVSDVIQPQLYNSGAKDWLPKIDMLISCGDLPANYLDFLVTQLGVPAFHVLGNHCDGPHDAVDSSLNDKRYACLENLNARTINYKGVLMAGLEGSRWYNGGPHQYSEEAMTLQMWRLIPWLVLNKIRYGRYLDVMVTHAAPLGIGDGEDLPHKGFRCFVDFIDRFQPTYFLHGHIHRYNNLESAKTVRGNTTIMNVYGHAIVQLDEVVKADPGRSTQDGTPLTIPRLTGT